METKYFMEAFLLHLPQRKDFYEPNRQDCKSLQKLKCSTIFSWENMHSAKISQNFPVIFQYSGHIFIQILYKHYSYNYANNRPLVMRFELHRVR